MHKIIISFIILINSVLFIAGCSTSEPEVKNPFRFDIIDSVLRKNDGIINAELHSYFSTDCKKYNIFNFDYFLKEKNNKDTIIFFVLSRKENFSDTADYKRMERRKSYDLNLIKIDTPITAKLKINMQGDHIVLMLEPDLKFWKDGKIISTMYFSNEIKDIYIKEK